MEEQEVVSYEFGPYQVRPLERLLLRDGKPVVLTPKVFDTLLFFVQNNGRLLKKDELLNKLWADSIVEEGNLTQNIFMLRKILGENPRDHQYLVTIPLQGYKFVARVRKIYDEETVDDLGGRAESERGIAESRATKIAVLPFTLLNAAEWGHFAGVGMTDTLITKLGRLRGIVLRPTTAILKYVDRKEDLAAIGRELKVDALIDGTIQHLDNRIRVNVRMIRVSSGETLWANDFNENFTDIFAMQDSISRQVVQALKLQLNGEEQRQLTRNYTNNLEAYQLYIKGRYFWDRRNEEGLHKGIDYVNQVIAIDPNYALAYLGLADSFLFLGEYLYLQPHEAFPKARDYALKALELDSTLTEAQASLAEVALFYEWDWAKAEAYYQRSIEWTPNYSSGLHWYAWFLMTQGRFDEASEKIKQAQNLDPGSLTLNTVLGLPYYYQRRYDRAIEQFKQTLEMDPHFAQASYYLGSALTQQGLYDEAIAELSKGPKAEYGQQTSALLAYNYARSGKKSEALKELSGLKQAAQQRYVSPYLEAIIYTGLGERSQALAELERGSLERAAWMVFMDIDPFLDGLRDDQRFSEVRRVVGFPAQSL